MSAGRRRWTEEEVIALGTRCTVEQAGSILGLGGKQKAYEQIHAYGHLKATLNGEEFLIPAYKVRDRWWVQTRPIRELLGIEPNHNPNGAQGAERTRLEPEPSGAEDDGDNQGNRRFRAV